MFPSLVRLADKFLVAGLTAECERFILTDSPVGSFAYSDVGDQTLVKMLLAAVKYRLSRATLTAIMGRVAVTERWPLLLSLTEPIDFDWPGKAKAFVALAKANSAMLGDVEGMRGRLHDMADLGDDDGHQQQVAKCAVDGCNDVQEVWQCAKCRQWLCRRHGLEAVCHAPEGAGDFYRRLSFSVDMTWLQ